MKPYYEDDAVRLFHGDCREVLPQLPVADLLLTDPPYGLGIGYGRTSLGTRTIANDETTDLLFWLCDYAPVALAEDAWAAVWCGYPQVGPVQERLEASGLSVKTVGVWDKGVPTLGEGIRNQYEMFVLARNGRPVERYKGGNVWRETPLPGRPIHPHAKPIPLLERIVLHYSEPADLVVDPCVGSGSTLVAAKKAGRRAIGIELDEHYCEVAAERLGGAPRFDDDSLFGGDNGEGAVA